MEELVERYRKGDRTVRDKIIIELQPRAKRIAEYIAASYGIYGFRANELIAESYAYLVEIVDSVTLNDNNIKAYVNTVLPRRLRDFLWEDSVVKQPASSHRLLKKDRPSVIHTDDFEVYDDGQMVDLLEDLDQITETQQEKDFIRLRLEGYRSIEISAKLRINPSVVSQMRSMLYRRYLLLQGDK